MGIDKKEWANQQIRWSIALSASNIYPTLQDNECDLSLPRKDRIRIRCSEAVRIATEIVLIADEYVRFTSGEQKKEQA